MILPSKYYNFAKKKGWIKKAHEIEKRKCSYCMCSEYYTMGAAAYTLIERV